MRVAVICIWGEEAIKRPNWQGGQVLFWEQRADIEFRGVGASCRVVLFWERRADIELRGVGASCRVMLFWELVQAA